MRESFAHSRYHHNTAVPSAKLYFSNRIGNNDRSGSQSSEVNRSVGRAEGEPFVNDVQCALTSQTLKPKGDCGKVFSNTSAKHQNVKQPVSDSNTSPDREAKVVLALKSENISKAGNKRGLLLDVGFPASVCKVVSSCESQNVVSPDVGSPSRSEGRNTHNELLEDKPRVLSESSLLSPDSISSSCEFDQLTPKQRAEVDAEFERVHRTAVPPLKRSILEATKQLRSKSQSMKTAKKLVSNRLVNSILIVIMRPNLTCSSVTSCQPL